MKKNKIISLIILIIGIAMIFFGISKLKYINYNNSEINNNSNYNSDNDNDNEIYEEKYGLLFKNYEVDLKKGTLKFDLYNNMEKSIISKTLIIYFYDKKNLIYKDEFQIASLKPYEEVSFTSEFKTELSKNIFKYEIAIDDVKLEVLPNVSKTYVLFDNN